MGDSMPFAAVLGQAFLLGPIGGVIGLYFGGWLFGWVGRKLGGQGSSEMAIYAWLNGW
jgi:hypothetical protein